MSVTQLVGQPAISDAIEAAQAGDLEAFECLVLTFQAEVRGYLGVHLGRHPQVDDLAQETFLIALRRLEAYDRGAAFGAWLCGIALNLLRNYRRKHARQVAMEPQSVAEILDEAIETELEEQGGVGELLPLLKHCLDDLKPSELDLVRRYHLSEESLQNLADQSGKTRSALAMTLHRSRQKLRLCIERQKADGVHA